MPRMFSKHCRTPWPGFFLRNIACRHGEGWGFIVYFICKLQQAQRKDGIYISVTFI